MKKLLKQQADLEKEVRRAKRRKKKENVSDDTALSMFTVRKLHVDVKLDLLRNIQDACEKQLVVEADQRREQDRLHMEKQREIHRNGLDPSLVKEAALDRESWGDHRAEIERKKERRKRWEADLERKRKRDREEAIEAEKKENETNGPKKKRRGNDKGISKTRATTTTSRTRATRIARKRSAGSGAMDLNNSLGDSTEKYHDDGSDANFKNRQKKSTRSFEALPGTDGARAHSTRENGDTNDNHEEEEEDVLVGGALRIPGDLYDKLFNYQQHCVGWMWDLHVKHVGGILGDEMGLGKTIQVIAFLSGLHHSGLHKRPTLILCPATVMVQWLQELHKWYPPFRVWLLHPTSNTLNLNFSHEEMVKKAFEVGDIVITTYSTFRSRRRIFLNKDWGYVICDEGHKIRNPDADITICLKQIRTVHRLLLTGAPMQNNLKELWSLFDFVCPGRMGTLPLFEAQFIEPIRRGGYANASRLHVQMAFRCATVLRDIMEPYLLRRLKEDVAKQLPKKIERVLFCKLTPLQREYYLRYLESREVNEVLKGERRSFKAITVLRKICNHVDLQDTHSDDITKEKIQYGQNWASSGKMIVLDQVLTQWFKNGDKALLFSQTKQMLDIIEMYVNQKGYNYLRMDGDTTISRRSNLVDNFNENENIFLFLLTTRVGGLGLNLIGANRVILFDPDWNPAVDVQARERVWRIGQTQNVTIYRLISTGTIEEKMYHRQIFKTFLANKILKDPRQKRFFKSQDLYELFTLAPEEPSGVGTETGQIFGAGSEQIKLEDVDEDGYNKKALMDDDPSASDTLNNSTNYMEGVEEDAENSTKAPSKSKDTGDEDVMKALWNGSKLTSAFRHDIIDNNGNMTGSAAAVSAAQAAKRFAETSRNALRRSRLDVISGNSRFGPTWTGRRGDKGGPTGSESNSTANDQGPTLRFGTRQNRSLMQRGTSGSSSTTFSNTTINNGTSGNPIRGIDASSRIIVDTTQSTALSSTDLLSRFQSRFNESSIYSDASVDPNLLPNFVDPAGTQERSRHMIRGGRGVSSVGISSLSNADTLPRTNLQTTVERKEAQRRKDGLGFLLGGESSTAEEEKRKNLEAVSIELRAFLAANVGRCSTELILTTFNKYIDRSEAKGFKKILREMAEVHDGFWHLKRNF